MEIYPLALTQVDWSTFINTVRDVLGYSPTRGLDTVKVEVQDPSSYLRCLNLENDAARLNDPSFRHFHFSFIAVLDEESLLLLTSTDLTITAKRSRRDSVVIISGTMDVWIRTILYACREDRPYELRAAMCIVLAHLERAGFRYLFNEFEKRQLSDGSFTLRS